MALIVARRGCNFVKCGTVSLQAKNVLRLSKIHGRLFQRHSSSTSTASAVSFQKNNPECTGDASSYSTRSHSCGDLRRQHVGLTVCLKGWVQFDRKKFLVLRDAYGTTQVLLDGLEEGMQKVAESLTLESVVEIQGKVTLRPDDQVKHNMPTGEIEVKASHITVLGAAPNQMPMLVKGAKLPTEQMRMRYRYLYLRFPHMQKMLRIRSQLIHSMRDFLIQKHFVDVETPTLFRKTPGGAQEFIVPTQARGLFYSLVQSPQQFKQLLMVGGLDRYFQVARCYRDESVRPDRQPEFTQMDIELSFVNREGVILLIEDLLRFSWPSDLDQPNTPFPRMTYHNAMAHYGSDKPDLRFGSKICDVTHLLCPRKSNGSDHSDLKKNSARAILFSKSAAVLRKDQWEELRKELNDNQHSLQLFFIPVKQTRDLKSSLQNVISTEEINKIVEHIKPVKGDLFVMCLGPDFDVLKLLGTARVMIANALEANGHPVRDNHSKFLWVVDFPLFEKDENGNLLSAHHPFTQPHPDDLHLLATEPTKVRGLHYDLVLNGSEIGGGSIRISDAQLQKHILQDILHLDTSTLQHLLDALSLGCPPHGGIALGLDRLVSIICGVNSIREVIAFPKGSEGKDPMAGAPAPLTAEDAKLYKLPLSSNNKKT